jgi:hypothetical protein
VRPLEVSTHVPRASVDLSKAWRYGGATLSGQAEAVHGEVATMVDCGVVEGFSGRRLRGEEVKWVRDSVELLYE